MNSTKFLFVIAIASVSFFSACSNGNVADETAIEKAIIDPAKVVAVDYKIEGMTCKMGCAKTIEQTIAGLNGVAASSVDFDSEKGHFEFDASVISEKEIISAIEKVADQYKVNEWTEEATNKEEITPSETKSEDKSATNVKLIPTFKIPNLFKLLINQL